MVFLDPLRGGGEQKTVTAISVDTFRGGRKGNPQHKTVRTTVGGEDSEYRCVVKTGFPQNNLLKKE